MAVGSKNLNLLLIAVGCILFSDFFKSASTSADENGTDLQFKFSEIFKSSNQSGVQINNNYAEFLELKGLTKEIQTIVKSVPKNAIFQMMNPNHKMAMASLTRILRAQKNLEDIFEISSILRDHPEMNYKLWLTSFIAVSLRIDELKFLSRPNLIQLMPDSFINYKALSDSKYQSGLPIDQQSCVVIDGTVGLDNGEENRLWYFREDLLTNVQHIYWHIANLGYDPERPEDRRGELFYYFHHHIVARYNAERLSNGFSRVDPFVFEEGYVVSDGYNPHMSELNAELDWTERLPNTVLQNIQQDVELMELIYFDINSRNLIAADGSLVPIDNSQGVDILGETVEASLFSVNPDRYTPVGIHNVGHQKLGNLSVGGMMTSIMSAPYVAMRDPIFYRWHKLVDQIFETHSDLLTPYTPTEGEYPLLWPGVEILDLSVRISAPGQDTTNVLKTFFGNQTMNLTIAGDIVPIVEAQEYCITRLEHSPFEYQIKIDRKPEVISGNATVRIFLAPRFNESGSRFSMEEQRTQFFALDAFSIDLTVGENAISRMSSDSPLLGQWSFEDPDSIVPDPEGVPHCGCGWPQHLLLPKGTVAGMAFDLFVIVTNGLEDSTGQESEVGDVCATSYMLCGILDKKYPDVRPMGYPFDRAPFNVSVTEEESRMVADLDEYVAAVGNMKAVEVRIFHED